jgi:hypothetical protein
VNTLETVGFYPTGRYSELATIVNDPVQGIVHVDDASAAVDTIVLHTSAEQDEKILEFIVERSDNPSYYRFFQRNCAEFVRDALAAAGIILPRYPDSRAPKGIMRDIRTHFGGS